MGNNTSDDLRDFLYRIYTEDDTESLDDLKRDILYYQNDDFEDFNLFEALGEYLELKKRDIFAKQSTIIH